jgi:hypothetical protein
MHQVCFENRARVPHEAFMARKPKMSGPLTSMKKPGESGRTGCALLTGRESLMRHFMGDKPKVSVFCCSKCRSMMHFTPSCKICYFH